MHSEIEFCLVKASLAKLAKEGREVALAVHNIGALDAAGQPLVDVVSRH